MEVTCTVCLKKLRGSTGRNPCFQLCDMPLGAVNTLENNLLNIHKNIKLFTIINDIYDRRSYRRSVGGSNSHSQFGRFIQI